MISTSSGPKSVHPKNNPPLIVDRDRMAVLPVAFQRLKAMRGGAHASGADNLIADFSLFRMALAADGRASASPTTA
jgi:hypothetical protein